jgi:hypothetical protein
MVEANSEDQTMAFFNAVFDTVPPVYRQVDPELLDTDVMKNSGKKATQKSSKKTKNVSLLELNELAHDKLESIRRANAEKSVARIKELTIEHQKLKNGPAVVKDDDPDVSMSGEEETKE